MSKPQSSPVAMAVSWITNPGPGEIRGLCFSTCAMVSAKGSQNSPKGSKSPALGLSCSGTAFHRWQKCPRTEQLAKNDFLKSIFKLKQYENATCLCSQPTTPLQTRFCTLMLHLLVLQHDLRHQRAFVFFLSPSCAKPRLIWLSCQVLKKKSCSSQHFRVHWGKIKG